MDLTVAVATYGGASWIGLAERRAIPSATAQGVPVVHVHANTLLAARNQCLDQVTTEWIVHLDADDELELGYVAAMATGIADVRAPSVRYVQHLPRLTSGRGQRSVRPSPVRVPTVAGHTHTCQPECLAYGNWIVVGAAARVDVLRKVGGWRDFPWSEDWDLWARCWLAGATIEPIPSAIYRAYVRRDSRNRSATRDERLAAHRAIATANGLPIP